MTLKSIFHIILAVSILLAAVGAMAQPGLDQPASAYQEENLLILPDAPGISATQPLLACIGCSGNGGGPG